MLVAQVYKPADTLVLFDSWYTCINPSGQNEVSVLTGAQANEHMWSVNEEQTVWPACEVENMNSDLLMSKMSKFIKGEYCFITVTLLRKMEWERDREHFSKTFSSRAFQHSTHAPSNMSSYTLFLAVKALVSFFLYLSYSPVQTFNAIFLLFSSSLSLIFLSLKTSPHLRRRLWSSKQWPVCCSWAA